MRITADNVVNALDTNGDIVLPSIDDPLVFVSNKEVWAEFNEYRCAEMAAWSLTQNYHILRYL